MTQNQEWNRIIHSIHTFFRRNQTDHASSFVNEQKDESMTPYAEDDSSKMTRYLFSRNRVAKEVQTIISKRLWLAFHFWIFLQSANAIISNATNYRLVHYQDISLLENY